MDADELIRELEELQEYIRGGMQETYRHLPLAYLRRADDLVEQLIIEARWERDHARTV